MVQAYLSTSDVANLFDVNRVTVYRWVREGKIRAFEIGKNLKIPLSEVERLFREFGFSRQEIFDISERLHDVSMVESLKRIYESRSSERIVVAVDSDKEVLAFLLELFENTDLKQKSRLITFSSALAAAIQIGMRKPSLLLIGERLNDFEGKELGERVMSTYEDINVVFIAKEIGFMAEDSEQKFHFLKKPLNFKETYGVICHWL